MVNETVSPERANLAKEWLEKAESDYRAALLLSNGKPTFYDQVCFHCHQAVEKLFKGVIIYHTGTFEKIHNLVALLKTLESLGVKVEGFTAEEISDLDPYYTKARYPSAAEYTKEEAQEAIKVVEKVKRFVEHKAGLSEIKFDKSWWERV